MPKVNPVDLKRWRELNLTDTLEVLTDYAKQDSTFHPIGNPDTTRWNLNANGNDFELLFTGTKFYDTRSQKGGGGAIDLVLHLFSTDFLSAVDILRSRGL